MRNEGLEGLQVAEFSGQHQGGPAPRIQLLDIVLKICKIAASESISTIGERTQLP